MNIILFNKNFLGFKVFWFSCPMNTVMTVHKNTTQEKKHLMSERHNDMIDVIAQQVIWTKLTWREIVSVLPPGHTVQDRREERGKE